MRDLIKNVHNEDYCVGSGKDCIGYNASGELTDWAYGEKGILAFTVELRPDTDIPGFLLPTSEIQPTFEENLPAALYLAGLSRSRVMDFEDGIDRQPIRSKIPGMHFTTTQGYDWIFGDWLTGNYNGPYPNGQYTSNGDFFAWLGENQGTGRIDFIGASAQSLSVWTSTYSGLTMDAFDSNNNLIANSGWASNNLNTGQMTKLTVTAPDMAYVLIHDSGNYWLIDDLEVRDIIANTQSFMPGKYQRSLEVSESFNTGEIKNIEFQNTTTRDLNIVLDWGGSEFGLKITKPDGSSLDEVRSQEPPINILIPNAEPGIWILTITAYEVDPNEAAALIVGAYNQNDIDNDEILSDIDNCPTRFNPDQMDSDNDGIGNLCDNCPNLHNPLQEDLYPIDGPEGSGNGVGDACEEIPEDPDEDQIPTNIDNCPFIPNLEQIDTDDDGIGNVCDNCPTVKNADQVDNDRNGIGDACEQQSPIANAGGPYTGTVGSPVTVDLSGSYDPDGTIVLYECDWNGDGVYDDSSTNPIMTHAWAVPYTGNMTLRVTDNDGLTSTDIAIVEIEEDQDFDGVPDRIDNCIETPNPDQSDVDIDGLGDLCDICPNDAANDADNDGVCGDIDYCPATVLPEAVPTKRLILGHYADIDGDGIFETRKNVFKPNTDSEYTLEDTHGCSCEQIINLKPVFNIAENYFGCSQWTMWKFINKKR